MHIAGKQGGGEQQQRGQRDEQVHGVPPDDERGDHRTYDDDPDQQRARFAPGKQCADNAEQGGADHDGERAPGRQRAYPAKERSSRLRRHRTRTHCTRGALGTAAPRAVGRIDAGGCVASPGAGGTLGLPIGPGLSRSARTRAAAGLAVPPLLGSAATTPGPTVPAPARAAAIASGQVRPAVGRPQASPRIGIPAIPARGPARPPASCPAAAASAAGVVPGRVALAAS